MKKTFNNTFENKKILVTGHTGFKGSWLTIWLQLLGAKIIGYSIDPPTSPSNFSVCGLESSLTHIYGDIRDYDALAKAIEIHEPEVIFHLAAQPLVLRSYEEPKETFDVNVAGTVNLLEAVRQSKNPARAVVIVTTDKVYENKEWLWGYRESDPLGGNDPYSASKSMAELAVSSYRKSFFDKKSPTAIASVRAGNVIGGGDFADFRLIPDAMRALMDNAPIDVRNPQSVRPWMHVLDPLSGYLAVAEKLLENGHAYADAWNFGPKEHKGISCKKIIEKTIHFWKDGTWNDTSNPSAKAEMQQLRLNWEKSAHTLHWHPVYGWEDALKETVAWFKDFEKYEKNPEALQMKDTCITHINRYVDSAKNQALPWATT